MAVARSFDDLFDLGKAEALVRRPDLTLAPGDITDFLMAAAAAMADKCIEHSASSFRKTFLDGSSGDVLTEIVNDRYNLQRTEAVKSSVDLTFTRPSAGGGELAGTIDAGTTVSTEPDENGERQEFVTDAAVSWVLAETGAKTVAATAVAAGRAGNVKAATITNIVDSLFDSTITVTNAAAAAGGNEQESDEALRERARTFPTTLRRATLAALEYGALQVDTVRVATAIEDDGGLVTVYVADQDGNSSTGMIHDVEVEIESWRAAGAVVQVAGGALFAQDVDVSLTVKAGTDVAALLSQIQSAVTARLARLEVGETLRREVIQAAVISVAPDSIVGVTVNTPAADVAPAANEVIRAGTVTAS